MWPAASWRLAQRESLRLLTRLGQQTAPPQLGRHEVHDALEVGGPHGVRDVGSSRAAPSNPLVASRVIERL